MKDFVPVCGLRQCTTCEEVKVEEDQFSFRNKAAGTRVSVCKTCVRENSRTWYQNNKDRHKVAGRPTRTAWGKKRREDNKVLVDSIKATPCKDCGQKFAAWIMQFDHIDATKKRGNVATMVHNCATREAILEEISKCDVVCANCHANRTYQRRMNSGRT